MWQNYIIVYLNYYIFSNFFNKKYIFKLIYKANDNNKNNIKKNIYKLFTKFLLLINNVLLFFCIFILKLTFLYII